MTPPGRSAAARWVLVIGLAATVWAAAMAVAVGAADHPPTGEESKIALHLAHGDGFRSPVDDRPDAPASAWSAPIYPALIAGAYRLFGVSSRAALVVLLAVNAMSLGLAAAAMCRLGLLVFGSPLPGGVAAALLAVDPLFYAGNFWDGLVSLALFSWLLVLVVDTRLGGRDGRSRAVLIGGLAGVLALTNTSYVFAFPVLAILLARRPRAIATAGAVLLVIVLPWSLRNRIELGRVVAIRTGAGVQMRIGNAPISHGWIDRHAYAFHPFVNPVERAKLLAMGEPAYDADALGQFAQAAMNDPVTYVVDCTRRVVYLLAGNPDDDVSSPGSGALRWFGVVASSLLAGIALGAMIAAARAGIAQVLLPAVIGSLALPFVASAVIDRYRLPIECLLFLYCGVAAWMIAARAARRSTPA